MNPKGWPRRRYRDIRVKAGVKESPEKREKELHFSHKENNKSNVQTLLYIGSMMTSLTFK
jgi:hypothetical protein